MTTNGFSEGMIVDASGTWTQLLERESPQRWQALSFEGDSLNVEEVNMRPLGAELLSEGVDLIIGPKSKEHLITATMQDCLMDKGYCVSCFLKKRRDVEDMHSAARQLDHHHHFTRVPAEFEPYYLGRDSREKHCLLDFEDQDIPEVVRNSPFADEDRYMSEVSDALETFLWEELGVRYECRTNLLVRQTFKDDEEELTFSAHDPDNDDRERLMGLMKRRRVCVIHFLGPETGTLTLIHKDTGEEIDLVAAPNRLVIFLTEKYHYSHVCESGATLAVQCWFLTRPPKFELQDIGGDLEVLRKVESGADGPTGEKTAVQGMGIYFGGDSKDDACMWLAVNKSGSDTFVEFPKTRWNKDEYCDHSDMQNAIIQGKAYTIHQGYVDGIELFDNVIFGISPSEAKAMDPNQRKCLETALVSLHSAGYDHKKLKSRAEPVGCFIGVSGSEWQGVEHDKDSAGCGAAEAIISNRLNFALNLKGSSITMNTACSSGLVAIHAGKLHLKYKDVNDPLSGVLGGGVQMAYAPWAFVQCCLGTMLSYKGRSFTFDTGADGYGRGEGCIILCMQLEPYCITSGFGLVAGSQSNQDGRSASITAPNGPSQEKCIKAALSEAKMRPPEVDCFECHGTGTALGDPIEVGAFRRIYERDPRAQPLAVTTSKTNYGHSEGAAGACGFTKCLLQCRHCEASPNLHLKQFNPNIDVAGFPTLFLTEGATTFYDAAYSGVSSFGFGGTNAHGMAYARNISTTRSIRASFDFGNIMMDRIEKAPTAKLSRPSEDPEEWETTGMPISGVSKPTMFQVEVTESGNTIWREVVPEAPASLGRFFHLSGTFNGWGLTPMREDPDVKGLFCADLTIGELGEELFHIVVDGIPDLLMYPSEAPCGYKTAPINGPEPPVGDMTDCAWFISSDPGTTFSIQFFRSGTIKTITWLRI
jgi:polyketide synthase-associated protein